MKIILFYKIEVKIDINSAHILMLEENFISLILFTVSQYEETLNLNVYKPFI